MKCCNVYLLVAAMAVSGVGMSTMAADTASNMDQTNQSVNTAGEHMQQMGGQMADEATQKDVRSTLAKVVNDSVDTNHFSNVVGYLSKADRDRIGDVKNQKDDDLNAAITQFRQDFKAKYNQDFDIQSEAFQNAMVYAGQDKKSATVSLPNPSLSTNATGMNSSNTVASSDTGTSNDTNRATSDRTLNTTGSDVTISNRSGERSGAAANSSSSGKATGPASVDNNSNSVVHGNDPTANPGVGSTNNMNNGGIASTDTTVTHTDTNANTNTMGNTMASASGATLNLVNEGHILNAWRLNVPDQISGEQLKGNLVKHIRMIDDQKATWPTDVNSAYHATAYHVLQAFSDSALATDR